MTKKDVASTAAKGRGRPSKYKKEYAEQARKLCLLGSTDADMADFFEVDERTINRWKDDHPDFCQSIKKGKVLADAEVADRLFSRAIGYDAPDVDIRVIENKIVETPLTKHYPPDTTAGIFWLKNRRKTNWRDKQEHEHTGKDGGAIVYADITNDELDDRLRELGHGRNKSQLSEKLTDS